MNSYTQSAPVIALDENSRGRFIARAYNHLFGAILAFVLLEIALFKTGLADSIANVLLSGSWLIVLGGFMVVSWIARSVAHKSTSKAAHYAALAGYVVAEAIIFVPLLVLADRYAPGAIASAAAVTFLGFVGLSLVAFFTRKDFSFLRGILCWGGIVAILLIVSAVIFGFQLGTFLAWPWWLWLAPQFSTTPPIFCITIPKTATSRPLWNCSPRWR